MDFNDLRYFALIVDHGGFTAAERVAHITKSKLSRRIALLEERMGVRLLQRSTRRVGLSEAGRLHLARCEGLLAELSDAEAAVSERNTALRGVLRASVPGGFGLTHLTPILPEFLRDHPQLSLDLQMTNRFVDLIEEGYDVAIRVGTLRDSRLAARKLGSNRRILVASPEYLRQHAAPRNPDDLRDHPCLILDVGDRPENWVLANKPKQTTITVSGPLRSNHVLALRSAAIQGAGIGLLPSFSLSDALADGSLVRVLPKWQTPEQGIYAVYPSYRLIPAKVRAFVDFIGSRLQPE